MYRADKPSRDYATQIRSYVMPRPIRPQYQSSFNNYKNYLHVPQKTTV